MGVKDMIARFEDPRPNLSSKKDFKSKPSESQDASTEKRKDRNASDYFDTGKGVSQLGKNAFFSPAPNLKASIVHTDVSKYNNEAQKLSSQLKPEYHDSIREIEELRNHRNQQPKEDKIRRILPESKPIESTFENTVFPQIDFEEKLFIRPIRGKRTEEMECGTSLQSAHTRESSIPTYTSATTMSANAVPITLVVKRNSTPNIEQTEPPVPQTPIAKTEEPIATNREVSTPARSADEIISLDLSVISPSQLSAAIFESPIKNELENTPKTVVHSDWIEPTSKQQEVDLRSKREVFSSRIILTSENLQETCNSSSYASMSSYEFHTPQIANTKVITKLEDTIKSKEPKKKWFHKFGFKPKRSSRRAASHPSPKAISAQSKTPKSLSREVIIGYPQLQEPQEFIHIPQTPPKEPKPEHQYRRLMPSESFCKRMDSVDAGVQPEETELSQNFNELRNSILSFVQKSRPSAPKPQEPDPVIEFSAYVDKVFSV